MNTKDAVVKALLDASRGHSLHQYESVATMTEPEKENLLSKNLKNELGLDSLDRTELLHFIEENLGGIQIPTWAEEFRTGNEIVAMIEEDLICE